MCVTVEKDPILLTESLVIFKEALYAQAFQEIQDFYQQHQDGALYHAPIMAQLEGLPTKTPLEIAAMLGTFKSLLKAIPILHQKISTLSGAEPIKGNDLYRLEGNVHHDKKP